MENEKNAVRTTEDLLTQVKNTIVIGQQQNTVVRRLPLMFDCDGKAIVFADSQERAPRSGILSGIDVDYYKEMVRRIYREHKKLIHPRTHEIIIGATDDVKPPRANKLHLAGFPRVPYHRVINRVQVEGKFVVQPRSSTERVSPTDISKLQYTLQGKLRFRNTSQWKSVWNTRYQRRSRA